MVLKSNIQRYDNIVLGEKINMDCKESVKEYCRNLGLNLIGFTKCRIFHELIPGLTKEK